MMSETAPAGLGARALLRVVGFYRSWISPALPPSCRYTPTCSAYAAASIVRFGALRGSYLAVRRILTCHPFHRGGTDPVPEAFSMRRSRVTASGLLDTPLPRLTPGV
ncbi:MAG: hypothetical protein JWN61_16 [Pseudonocardiales bacterium]|nr:hypothetical protein [Pseudonocardiales bacterium]